MQALVHPHERQGKIAPSRSSDVEGKAESSLCCLTEEQLKSCAMYFGGVRFGSVFNEIPRAKGFLEKYPQT